MQEIPDQQYYQPVFSPWLGYGEFAPFFNRARGASLVSPDRCWVLYSLLRQALAVDGDVWECGVYKGGTAAMMAGLIEQGAPHKKLRLFDTFEGMPETDAGADWHKKGDFADTSLQAVQAVVGPSPVASFHQGFMPQSFAGLEGSTIALAHVDVDIYKSVVDCCAFIWPRLSVGGFMLFDDYGFVTCPGARKAVDEFFAGSQTVPLVLPTGQAIAFKSRP